MFQHTKPKVSSPIEEYEIMWWTESNYRSNKIKTQFHCWLDSLNVTHTDGLTEKRHVHFWTERILGWLCNMYTWLGWTTFPRSPFLMCFSLQRATKEIHGRSGEQKRKSSYFCSSHTFCRANYTPPPAWSSSWSVTALPSPDPSSTSLISQLEVCV